MYIYISMFNHRSYIYIYMLPQPCNSCLSGINAHEPINIDMSTVTV